jgi:hypothetical protein
VVVAQLCICATLNTTGCVGALQVAEEVPARAAAQRAIGKMVGLVVTSCMHMHVQVHMCSWAHRGCCDSQPSCLALQQPPLPPVHLGCDAGHGSQSNDTHQHTCQSSTQQAANAGTGWVSAAATPPAATMPCFIRKQLGFECCKQGRLPVCCHKQQEGATAVISPHLK